MCLHTYIQSYIVAIYTTSVGELRTCTRAINIEVLQDARLSLNGFSHHLFSQDSLTFSAILRVNGIGRSMAKTIATIAI